MGGPATGGAVGPAERKVSRRRDVAARSSLRSGRLGSRHWRRSRGVRAMRARVCVLRLAGRVRLSCQLRLTRGATTCTPAAGPAGRRTGRVRAHRPTRTWTPTRSVLRAHPSGPASSRRQPRAVASPPYFAGAYQVFTRSARSITSERHLQRGRDPAARLLVGGDRRLRLGQRSGDCPTAATRSGPVVASARPRSTIAPPCLCTTARGSASRRAAAPRVDAPPRRAGSRPGTAPCSRPRTYPCVSTTGPHRR